MRGSISARAASRRRAVTAIVSRVGTGCGASSGGAARAAARKSAAPRPPKAARRRRRRARLDDRRRRLPPIHLLHHDGGAMGRSALHGDEIPAAFPLTRRAYHKRSDIAYLRCAAVERMAPLPSFSPDAAKEEAMILRLAGAAALMLVVAGPAFAIGPTCGDQIAALKGSLSDNPSAKASVGL